MNAIDKTAEAGWQAHHGKPLDLFQPLAPGVMRRFVFVFLTVATGLLTGYLLWSGSEFAISCALIATCGVFPLICGWLLKVRMHQLNRKKEALRWQACLELMMSPALPKANVPADILILSPDSRFRFVSQDFLDNACLDSEEVCRHKYVM